MNGSEEPPNILFFSYPSQFEDYSPVGSLESGIATASVDNLSHVCILRFHLHEVTGFRHRRVGCLRPASPAAATYMLRHAMLA